jgi:glycosyltransferase involved in cell wall biosynthesis
LQVHKEISNSNAFVLCSLHETFGVVLIESLAVGRPVISTKCGGPEYIINATNGILVDSPSKFSLYAAMVEMIQNFSKYNLRLISLDCINEFGAFSFGKKILDVYKSALV